MTGRSDQIRSDQIVLYINRGSTRKRYIRETDRQTGRQADRYRQTGPSDQIRSYCIRIKTPPEKKEKNREREKRERERN